MFRRRNHTGAELLLPRFSCCYSPNGTHGKASLDLTGRSPSLALLAARRRSACPAWQTLRHRLFRLQRHQHRLQPSLASQASSCCPSDGSSCERYLSRSASSTPSLSTSFRQLRPSSSSSSHRSCFP